MSHILGLPLELLRWISKFLSFDDFGAFALCSRHISRSLLGSERYCQDVIEVNREMLHIMKFLCEFCLATDIREAFDTQ